MIKLITSGESHGKALITVVNGIPANLTLNENDINVELNRRRMGYGRGKRMQLEGEKAEILSGVRKGKTIGSPIAISIWNKDWHKQIPQDINIPRPGHADLAGALKYGQSDIRNIWERSSARETAGRVAGAAVAKKLLKEFRIEILSHVISIGVINAFSAQDLSSASLKDKLKKLDPSKLRCVDKEKEKQMIRLIDKAKAEGDSLGGVFEVIVFGVPFGLGSYVQCDDRLDAKLAFALMSIPGIKGVEIGMGFEAARKFGSEVQDEIFYEKRKGFFHKTNNAGGIEGGISNAEPIILRAAMKPIPTLANPLRSVNLKTKKSSRAPVLRSDVCAVPAAGIVGEAMVAIEIASAMKEKFGGDSTEEMKRNYNAKK